MKSRDPLSENHVCINTALLPLVWGPCTPEAHSCPHPDPDSKLQLGDHFLLNHTVLAQEPLEGDSLFLHTDIHGHLCVPDRQYARRHTLRCLCTARQGVSRPGSEVLPFT